MRLNKYLALARGISRRQADELIESGAVAINGQPAELGKPVSEADEVTVNGRPVSLQAYQYVLFHKPRGYVSSRREQGENQTIYQLIDEKLHHLKPVGRLDKDSSGVMLLTNDGDYTHTLLHPSFHKTKQYTVQLDMPLSETDRRHITKGVELQDGVSRLTLEGKDTHWIVSMHEGRNRQIRRTFAHLRYTVTKLHRTHFGPYELGDLKAGSIKNIEKIDK